MRSRALVIGAVVVLLAAPTGPLGVSARAAVTTAGSIAFTGTADLGTFPCPPPAPFGSGPCDGSFGGDWTGHVTGVSGTSAFDVTWSTQGAGISSSGAVAASFQYSEVTCLGIELLVGIAAGSGTAYAGPGQVQGKWQVPGETFARDVTAVAAAFEFQWTRIGSGAVLVMSPFALSLSVSGLPDQVVVSGPQVGAASLAFVPPTGGVPTCAQPVSIHGTIAGSVVLGEPV